MNRQMWIVAFVAVAFTGATLAAQTSGTPSSQSSSGTITLTGCLQKGSASGGTTGTSGTGSTSSTSGTSSSSSSSGGQFVLTNAQMGSGSSSRSSSSGTSGTAGAGSSSSSASSGSRYILEGQESELTKHVGEKVEITGTLASGSSSSSPSATSSAGTSGTSASGSASMPSSSGQKVKVQSVTTVASSCSQ
jgi:hypothetical protein